MLRSVPAYFETLGQTLQQIVRLVLFDLPDDYFSSYVTSLESITLADVHRVAEARIHDNHLNVLVVGDKSVIEPGLKEIGLPIVEVDYEGHRVA
jgi:predicted Zn-dependent peptidase